MEPFVSTGSIKLMLTSVGVVLCFNEMFKNSSKKAAVTSWCCHANGVKLPPQSLSGSTVHSLSAAQSNQATVLCVDGNHVLSVLVRTGEPR